MKRVYDRVTSQPENPFVALIPNQEIAIIPSFTLESGVTLHNVPVAYITRGKLTVNRDNAMVICHALSGSADVADWWGPLLGGSGRAFDVTRFFIICINCLGSPYGTASPVTNKDGDPEKGRYGPEFPLTTVRDDVSLHKLLLDDLGVRKIAVVIGGSMGGMLALEWAYLGKEYVRSIVPIATSSRHSAWGIGWGEAQRASIYADPKYGDGDYSFDDGIYAQPPASGLGAARMAALLTYRSRESFENRFSRNPPDPSRQRNINGSHISTTPSNGQLTLHDDVHQGINPSQSARANHLQRQTNPLTATTNGAATPPQGLKERPTTFSAQTYLQHHGSKFVKRFDSNCYIATTRKMDTHDVSRGRVDPASPTPMKDALSQIEQPTLVIGIESDGLFTFDEQQDLKEGIPNARLRTIDSLEGHDAFLLQFGQVNHHILEFLKDVLPDLMTAPPVVAVEETGKEIENGVFVVQDGAAQDEDRLLEIKKNGSLFGEMEGEEDREVEDITAW
ncbi:MAG: homoserine O- acetyltransferase [Peltula sp. TS41687]|nr:MAG: homoserine O- acetyltransferase [Peltula sp. TS41687]